MGKFAKYYAIATQGILSIVVLLLLGYYIGRKINPDGILPGLLAMIGALSGVTSFVYILFRLLKKEEKRKSESPE